MSHARSIPAAGTSCSFPVTATDATGTAVTVPEEPDRVVTLAPSAAQTMWEIGGREKVVGLTRYASYLDGADRRTNVTNAGGTVVTERVIALEPDLVLAPGAVSNETVAKLREAGQTVYAFPSARAIDDVIRKTRRIGRLTGECDGAEQTVSWMRERLDVVREAVDGRDPPGVLYLFYGYTAGTGTFIHEVIETAGGNNLAADRGISWYKPINREVVVRSNPDWIVLNSDDPAVPDDSAYDVTRAVREGQVVVVPIEHLNQPGPRVVYAVTRLARHFHPEAYARANATANGTMTPPVTASPSPPATGATARAGTATANTTPTGSTTTTSPSSTPTPGQPGFGPLALLVALACLLAGRRRT